MWRLKLWLRTPTLLAWPFEFGMRTPTFFFRFGPWTWACGTFMPLVWPQVDGDTVSKACGVAPSAGAANLQAFGGARQVGDADSQALGLAFGDKDADPRAIGAAP